MKEGLKNLLRYFYYRLLPHYRMFYPEWIKDLIARKYIRNGGLQKTIWGQEVFKEAIDKNLRLFLSDTDRSKESVLKVYTFDMVKAYLFYGVAPEEDFMFSFNRLIKQKKT